MQEQWYRYPKAQVKGAGSAITYPKAQIKHARLVVTYPKSHIKDTGSVI